MYEDKTLVCKDCGAEFVFTAGEQEFYAEKGFQNEPMLLFFPSIRVFSNESALRIR